MARVLSQTLTRITSLPLPNPTILYSKSSTPSPSPSPSPSSLPLPLSSRILSCRNRSNQSGKALLVEVDLESEGGGSEVEVMSVRKLEDVIHSIIVRRSAPNWIPFIPGSSYWVPPWRRPSGVVNSCGMLTNTFSEESMHFTERGWPSSGYYIEGIAPTHPVPVELQAEVVEVEVEVEVDDNSDNASRSADEES